MKVCLSNMISTGSLSWFQLTSHGTACQYAQAGAKQSSSTSARRTAWHKSWGCGLPPRSKVPWPSQDWALSTTDASTGHQCDPRAAQQFSSNSWAKIRKELEWINYMGRWQSKWGRRTGHWSTYTHLSDEVAEFFVLQVKKKSGEHRVSKSAK